MVDDSGYGNEKQVEGEEVEEEEKDKEEDDEEDEEEEEEEEVIGANKWALERNTELS